MSKFIREKHTKIIELLVETASIVDRLLRNSQMEKCLLLLSDCQESAIALGRDVEKLYGIQTQTVNALEGYCEALYQLSEAIENGRKVDAYYQIVYEATSSIQKVYNEEFPSKKEIVFLPYKASMWDSLESVWEAASKDETCSVYVVPIPYYDKTPDGNLGECHYEGDLFPEYVPIVHYEDYDIIDRRPEVIYIHNPYDEYNRVTSVDPRFYSKELKQYTDMLVYIPYFVVDESCSIQKIETYALSPVVFNADRVIVQSKKIKKMYIDALMKQVDNVSRKTWETKILGLGSPKYDAVYKLVQNPNDIPTEWQEIIGNKKVVLYNTHLSLMMPSTYVKFLKKLKSVIALFRKRDDVVLLWRPHPLMVATAKSMNPDALDEYMAIVNEFRQNRYGIYDDSSDMNRALAISDAYYGSNSSMFPLYKATGKPALLHSIYIDLEDTE